MESSENLQQNSMFYLQINNADFFNKDQYSRKLRAEIESHTFICFNIYKNGLREEFILTDFSKRNEMEIYPLRKVS